MAVKQTIFLIGYRQKEFAKQCIDAALPDECCTIKKATRREIQSSRFHAMCGDVARQKKFINRTLTKNQWKVIFISGHAVATGRGADVMPGLEGEFVNIREATAEMSIPRMSSLIEYVAAWGSHNDVQWTEPREQG